MPVRALAYGLAVALRAQTAPTFAEILIALYDNANRRDRAELLNTLVTLSPRLRYLLPEFATGKSQRITLQQIDSLPIETLRRSLASKASLLTPLIEDIRDCLAHRSVLLFALDREVRTMVLTALARAEVRGAAEPAEARHSRSILVTGHTASGELASSFRPETPYSLLFRVSGQFDGSLAQGDTDLTSVPEAGLAARWVVSSTNVKFLRVSPAGTIMERGSTHVAEFDLPIPGRGDSPTVTLDVRTTKTRGDLLLILFVAGEEYRKLTVRLASGARVTDDIVCIAPGHLNLRTKHDSNRCRNSSQQP